MDREDSLIGLDWIGLDWKVRKEKFGGVRSLYREVRKEGRKEGRHRLID
jgi:hypothetical protein